MVASKDWISEFKNGTAFSERSLERVSHSLANGASVTKIVGTVVGTAGTGYAVGDNGAVFRSDDTGKNWIPITQGAVDRNGLVDAELRHYWKLPAPWIQFTWLLSLTCLGIAVLISIPEAETIEDAWNKVSGQKVIEVPSAQVANFTVSDRPLGPDDFDALGFGAIARGISGFLRNRRTLLPVTIAINGAWGLGKSSMMNLIYRDLDDYGFRPMMFNAWHHQEDDNLLASLLQSVKEEAPPELFSTAGMIFRMRLGWQRLVRLYPRALRMIAIAVVLLGAEYTCRHYSAELSNLPKALQVLEIQLGTLTKPAPPEKSESKPEAKSPASGVETPKASDSSGPNLLSMLLAMVMQLFSFADKLVRPSEYAVAQPLAWLYVLLRIFPSGLKRLQAFTENPASLLHASAPGASEKQLEAQTSFRMRFAREFCDVTKALGDRRRLAIFIDDLDRCRPAKVAEMLEAVNYIVVSGECAVIMGLETEAVKAAVGLSFKDVAEELFPPVPTADLLSSAEQKRRRFAVSYIEKLINIEINVPTPSDKQKEELLEQARERSTQDAARNREKRILGALTFAKRLASLAVLLGLSWAAGMVLVQAGDRGAQRYLKAQQKTEAERGARAKSPVALGTPPAPATAQPGTQPPPATATTDNTATGATAIAPAPTSMPEIQPGESPFPASLFEGWKAWVTLGLLAMTLMRVLSRVPGAQTGDSDEFARALALWGPVAGLRLGTPRSVKRFLNRVRCLAMLQRPPKAKRPALLRWLVPHADIPETVKPIPEENLVALSAIEAYQPELINDPNKLAAFLKSTELADIFGQLGRRQPNLKPEQFFEESNYWGIMDRLDQYKELRSGGLMTA